MYIIYIVTLLDSTTQPTTSTEAATMASISTEPATTDVGMYILHVILHILS